jgi:PKD repeat protein
VYTAPGTYTVILTVQASNGQADAEVKTNYIVVNPTPASSFTASTNGCTLPVGVTFNNTSTGGVSYSWNFGNSQTSTAQNPPAQNYSTAGTYNVTLITTNSFGCKDTLIQPIVVSNFQAGINAPATACQNMPVTIQDASTIGANNWNWTFTGATTGSSTAQNNTITYTSPGTYTILLTSQNTGSGCSGNTSQQITVLPTPVPSFTNNPTTGCAPLPVTFTNTSGAGTFVWDFGDGSPTFSGQNPPVHNYTTNGSYTVTLTMTNANGCVGTFSTVAVNMVAPVANFTSDVVNGCDPLSVQFTDASTGSGQTINSWTWIFGDGSPNFNGQNPPVHVYNLGVYDVTLVVSTTQGCVDTVSMADYIQVGHIDLVDFDIDATPECAKTNIDFTNQSVILAPHDPSEVTYFWDFGDGGTSTLENPGYQYAADTGYFDVTLIVTWRGCKDTLVLTDGVYIKAPISIFSPDITLFCNQGPNGHVVTVNDNSKINSVTPPQDALVTWHWGDGSPNTVMDDPLIDDADRSTTTHTYNGYGSYTIMQVIHNYTTGCADSTTAVVHVSMTDITAMTSANDSVCKNSALNFGSTVNVQAASHNPVTYAWTMGDGGTTSGQNPTYTYTVAGTYDVQLTATNNVGCADNQTLTPIVVLELPSASMTPDDNTGCAPFTVVFTNTSSLQGNGVPLSSFTWNFPSPTQTTTTNNVGQTVSHTFDSEGVFNPTIVATDVFGCQSAPGTTTITITKPVANFTVDAVVCELENFVASNTSSGVAPMTYQWSIDGTQVSTSQDYPGSHNEPASNSVSSWVHNYQLITTDANGCKDTIVQPVTVSTPVAIIDYVLSGAATNDNGDFLCPPVFATFTDESLTLGNITGYSWIFGDGKTSILTNPSNTYVFPGTYSVTLNITDEYGCTSDTTLVDYLTIFGPSADPSWVQDPTQCGQLVDFTIGDTSNVTDIIWSMGDGVTVNDSTDFTYGYLDVTTYNPSVTVFDDNGCQVIYPLDPITIPDNGLNAQFGMGPNPADLGDVVVFDDISTANSTIVSWTWDLVNIDPFTLNNGSSVSSTYVSPGDFLITLIIQDNNGCFDSYESVLHINGDFAMPNVITADGDGVNDVFEFKYPIFEKFDIIIVDRWGSVVQDQKNMTGKVFWDGRNKGQELVNDGVYHYILDAILTDGTPLHKDGFLHVYSNR